MGAFRKYASLWGPVVALGLANYYLSAQSKSTLWFLAVNGNGKVLHVVGSVVIGLFALRVCHGGFRDLSRRPVLVAVFVCFLWAVSDEAHQLTVPGRGTTPVFDVALDTAGVLLAVLLWIAVQCGFGIFRYLTHPKRPLRTSDLHD